MNLQRLRRLIQLIGLLQAGSHNADGLALECGVGRRTTFRDLETLREVGVPVRYDEVSRVYSLSGEYYIPPTELTTEEALAMVTLCQELGGDMSIPWFAAARRASVKLINSLPARIREQLKEVRHRLHISLEAVAPPSGPEDLFHTLVDALARRRCLRIAYRSPSQNQVTSTRLSPYHLLFRRHAWYILGRSSVHRAVRLFHVGRIEHMEILEETYNIPRNFSVQRHMRNAWSLIPGPGADSQVVVRFTRSVARNVAEVQWHPTQNVVFEADGSLLFRVQVSGLDEIVWWILGYGPNAQVLEPPELRERIRNAVQDMAQLYGVV